MSKLKETLIFYKSIKLDLHAVIIFFFGPVGTRSERKPLYCWLVTG